MLRGGVDIFVLQRLMCHADLQGVRRYIAQNDEDNQRLSRRSSESRFSIFQPALEGSR